MCLSIKLLVLEVDTISSCELFQGLKELFQGLNVRFAGNNC